MKRFRDRPFHSKIALIGLLIGLITILIIIGMLATMTTARMRQGNRNSLELLTEQLTVNFSNAVEETARNVYIMCSRSGVPGKLYAMSKLDPAGPEYTAETREANNLLTFMVTNSAPYDRVSVLPDTSSSLMHSNRDDREAIAEAEVLFEPTERRENNYNRAVWVRMKNGTLWMVRDIYNSSPLRHVGKLAARVRQDKLVTIGEQNASRRISVLFFQNENEFLTSVGECPDAMIEAAAGISDGQTETVSVGNVLYAVTVQKNGTWKAIGFQPMSVVDELNRHVTRIAVLTALTAIFVTLLLSWLAGHGMSARINTLVAGMKRVSQGDLDARTPVEGDDEIGQLAKHFNEMTGEMKNLLNRLVQQETEKQQAEYQNMEYEYRFLQWQVNPHFIYNALETVNGMAKLNGSEDVCEMIQSLSGYFRQNAETMRKRFVTVRQELRSLRQYVDIYRRIYGEELQVEYIYSGETSRAYLPTMAVQPLLENALIHGAVMNGKTLIRVTAEICGEQLVIRIEDNGPGMSDETVARILGPRNDNPRDKEEKTSLGVRNVLDRLELLFGEQAGLTIRSVPGQGTTVTMNLPLSFSEWTEESLRR